MGLWGGCGWRGVDEEEVRKLLAELSLVEHSRPIWKRQDMVYRMGGSFTDVAARINYSQVNYIKS